MVRTNVIRYVLTFFLLTVFIISSTGIVVYLHHCSGHNVSMYTANIEGSGCCSSGEHSHDDNLIKLSDNHDKGNFSGLSFNSKPCCADNEIFVKIELLNKEQVKNTLLNDIPVKDIISNYYPISLSDNKIKSTILRSDIDPPQHLIVRHTILRI